jgi:hypothetical protein
MKFYRLFLGKSKVNKQSKFEYRCTINTYQKIYKLTRKQANLHHSVTRSFCSLPAFSALSSAQWLSQFRQATSRPSPRRRSSSTLRTTTSTPITLRFVSFLSSSTTNLASFLFQIINAGGRRIGWAIKTTNMKRLGVDPPCGVLDAKEAVLMAVSCDAFQFGQEDTNNDRITIEWT